jgi:hypothetical protein
MPYTSPHLSYYFIISPYYIPYTSPHLSYLFSVTVPVQALLQENLSTSVGLTSAGPHATDDSTVPTCSPPNVAAVEPPAPLEACLPSVSTNDVDDVNINGPDGSERYGDVDDVDMIRRFSIPGVCMARMDCAESITLSNPR